jgi:predicted transcriptional regulator
LKDTDIKQSKLDLYVELLYQINQDPQKPARLFNSLETNEDGLQKRLTFLVEQGLVIQTKMGKQVIYQNTKKGRIVLSYLAKDLHESPSGHFISS